MIRSWSSFLTSSLRVLISDLVSLISCWRSLTVISFLALVNLLKIFFRLTGGSECFGLVSFVSLTKVFWNWLRYWALTIGSSTFSIKVSKGSSCWLRTLTDLFLQQLSLHPILMSGPLEMLDDSLEDDDWLIWKISWLLELLENSMFELLSFRSLKISYLLVWSPWRVLIKALALNLHSFLKWPFLPRL